MCRLMYNRRVINDDGNHCVRFYVIISDGFYQMMAVEELIHGLLGTQAKIKN